MRSKLALGTVQWGVRYGVSNHAGQTPIEEVRQVIDLALDSKINLLDTAALYGQAEEVIGQFASMQLEVVSKTPRLGPYDSQAAVHKALEVACLSSLARTRKKHFYGYLVHNAADLEGDQGQWVMESLMKLKSQGLIQKIGVSVYDSDQIQSVLEICKPDLVQLPINVLDRRLLKDGSLKKLKEQGVEIHARSAFLQGLLLMKPDEIPSYFDPIQPVLKSWVERVRSIGQTPLAAALAFVRDLELIDQIVLGVENSIQLKQIINAFDIGQCPFSDDLVCLDPRFVDPSQWVLS